MRVLLICICAIVGAASLAWAAALGSVTGVVLDPQQHPVASASVTLKALRADWSESVKSDAQGAFQFRNVPVGEYTLTASASGFDARPQVIRVTSGIAVDVRVLLKIGTVKTSIEVNATSGEARAASATPSTIVNRDDVAATPGAMGTNSMAAVTAFVPGAFMTHDLLHLRGGHQASWLIDGVPIPNTNIAGNVGPLVDPKDMDYLEIQRGSYDASFGDRTYGVFNVIPRTGFERHREAELVATFGNFRQTNDQISFGDHTTRTAYYGSLTFNHSRLGLETPVPETLHDQQRGLAGFGSVVFNASAVNQFRFVASTRADGYQIPLSVDDLAAGFDDNEREHDTLVAGSWLHALSDRTLLTVSPFMHLVQADYMGGAADLPTSTTDRHRSSFAGAQVTLDATRARHQIQVGFSGFAQRDRESFTLRSPDDPDANFTDVETPSGRTLAVFAQDAIRASSWLTLNLGVRYTSFSASVAEHAVSPRLGAAIRLPARDWIARAFYGHYYQGPPLVTAAGPILGLVSQENLGFIPLFGERDHEWQIGAGGPIRGWMFDSDIFETRARNFFDHNSVGNSNFFFPLTIDRATIRGFEITVRSPRTWTRGDLHAAYARLSATGQGAISGGLTDFEPAGDETFALDHDQRHTLSAGGSVRLRRVTIGATLSFGSGLPSDDGPLPSHATVDVSARVPVGKRLTLAVAVLNVGNHRVLIDDSLTFGGTHFNRPREAYVEVRYRLPY